MPSPTTYTARCWRAEDAWVVHVVELDERAHAARLSQVEAVARDLVARFGGDHATSARVVVDLQVQDDLMQLLNAAASVRADRDRLSVEAVTLRRGLARQLLDRGLTVREVAGLLGLSVVRTQQLVGETTSGAARAASRAVAASTGAESAGAESAGAATVAVATPPREKPHGAYQHEAFVYRGDDDFLATTVPFVLDAVSLGQPVLVAVALSRLVQLQAAVGPDAPGVRYVDMAELGANPARIIPAWRAFVEECGQDGQPVRGIGEPVWAGRRPTEIAECQLHEALLNLAVEPDTPLWLLCPYDADALAPSVLEEAARSHPSLREGDRYRGSTSYGGVHHVDRLFGDRLPDPPADTLTVTFEKADVADVRRRVGGCAREAGLNPDRTTDLMLAATEVATNSVRHGGGRGVLRVWQHGDAVVCEFSDRGHITDPLAGRRTPSLTTEGGRGLWLANQLCDLVQIRSAGHGTTVRLLTWI
jgi:anti-sigma regulatory factor (Ser/Thr protein kinase)